MRSITGYLLLTFMLLSGCGREKKIPPASFFNYPDPYQMFLKLTQTPDPAVTTEIKAVQPVSHLPSGPVGYAEKTSGLRAQIHQADFSEINSLVYGNSSNYSEAIRKLRLLKEKHHDNPFVVMQCSFYIADLQKKSDDNTWTREMDEAIKANETVQQNEMVREVFQESAQTDEFLLKFRPTVEVEEK